jgi:DNA-binding response OmpR family regulator
MSRSGTSVLIADHEPEVGEMSRRYLARAGLSVVVATSPAATLSALAAGDADLFVIDLTMPGLEVAAVRRALLAVGDPGSRALAAGAPRIPGPRVAAGLESPPVVFLLDRHGVRPRSLSDGLDCRHLFLARPFSPRALVDAVTDLLRPGQRPVPVPGSVTRLGSDGGPGPGAEPGPAGLAGGAVAGGAVAGGGQAAVGGPQLDEGHRRVTIEGRDVELTRTEFALVAALARHPGQPLSRQRLLAALEAERGKRPTARAIDVYITQVRAKLGVGVIRTVHGVGYAMCWPAEES